jgi:hypothetical protein
MHKMVNGKRVELTKKQEEEVLAQWKKNEEERALEKENKRVAKEQQNLKKNSAMQKLLALGLTKEEVESLLEKTITDEQGS